MSNPGDPADVSAGVTPTLTPEILEAFRRTGLRLDREGRFWHDGAAVTHAGLRRALLRWLDRLPNGRPILRLDENRYAYVDIDDAELLVTSVSWRGDRVELHLNDDTVCELEYDSLAVGEGDALYCTVRGGKLEARFTTAAYYTLTEALEETSGGFALRAAGRLVTVGMRSHARWQD